MARGGKRPSRGGYRRPGDPAPVSSPGALSARTDGGPANPILGVTGLPYGAKGALEDIAGAAPMGGAGGAPAGQTMGRGGPPLPDMYAPTDRPDEPITAGAAVGPGRGPLHIPPDPDEALWVMYDIAPSGDLLSLLEMRRPG